MTDTKIALVTGASRGIGQACLKALAEEGHTVIGTATSAQGVASINATLASLNAQGYALELNIADPDSISACFKSIEEKSGSVAILVNNAGITRDNLLMRMKDEEWQNVITTNLTSLYRMCKAALRPMMKARYGRIINLASVVAITGNAGQCNYAAAKAGVIGFSKSLAREVASRGITVNTIAPGFIQTDMTAVLSDEVRQKILAAIPLGHMGSPEDIAQAVVFLSRAAYITGETLHVNGGMHMV